VRLFSTVLPSRKPSCSKKPQLKQHREINTFKSLKSVCLCVAFNHSWWTLSDLLLKIRNPGNLIEKCWYSIWSGSLMIWYVEEVVCDGVRSGSQWWCDWCEEWESVVMWLVWGVGVSGDVTGVTSMWSGVVANILNCTSQTSSGSFFLLNEYNV